MMMPFCLPEDDDRVHHYTDTGGLIGVLNQNKLWATNISFLNDSLEYDFGLESVCLSFNEALERVKNHQDDMTPFSDELAKAVQFAIKMLEGTGVISKDSQFVSCFSRIRDDLGQWRGYAQEGYCISFDYAMLTESIKEKHEDAKAVRSGPVIYGNGDEMGQADYIHAVLARMHDILHSEVFDVEAYGFNRGEAFFTDLVENDDRHTLAALSAFSAVQQSIPLYKEKGFRSEQEVRVFVSHPGAVKFRSSRIGPIPYIELDFDPACIKAITVGPGLNIELRKTTLEYLLVQTFGKDHDIAVKKSNLSFRG